jgi:hypothetical protein
MPRLVEGSARDQMILLPECLDDYIAEDNPIRVVDSFVEELNLEELGFDGVAPACTGRPSTTQNRRLIRASRAQRRLGHARQGGSEPGCVPCADLGTAPTRPVTCRGVVSCGAGAKSALYSPPAGASKTSFQYPFPSSASCLQLAASWPNIVARPLSS